MAPGLGAPLPCSNQIAPLLAHRCPPHHPSRPSPHVIDANHFPLLAVVGRGLLIEALIQVRGAAQLQLAG
jgi:hypothetical protein